MSFSFDSVAIPGLAGTVMPGDWSAQAQETQYFGVQGVSQITGERGARDLTCNIWLYGSYTLATLNTAFRNLQAKILKNGKIVDALGITWENCTLMSVKVKAGPVYSPPIGWMYDLDLMWRQLQP